MPVRRTRSAGLAPLALLVSGVLLGPAFARATTFDVSGQYSYAGNPPTGTFSGTLTVSGALTGVDIQFPGWSAFQDVYESTPSGSNWLLTAYNDPDTQELDLTFTTNPTPGSLFGFTGGTIVSGQVIDVPSGGIVLFSNLRGSITPAPSPVPGPSAVPEPSGLGLLALGFLGFGLARKRH